MSSSRTYSLEEINSLSTEEFTSLFSNIIENCLEVSYQVSLKRPFIKINEVENVFNDYLNQLDNNGKENILNKHPQLKGKINKEELTTESRKEQELVEINSIAESQKLELMKLNELYLKKFSFPFIICVRDNNVLSILSAIKTRLENSKDVELNNGIEEVKKISKFRITDLLTKDNSIEDK
ncbi:2-oxo-4-hydroxy-4-carboxy-5-ureidoimidazoline decarboxylase-like [Chelonus insularis]|uniref:2-oxo-4-hydroxy-4-carboxy-5-ureidoimidazoline decarboxylase-like n=1 Tax=Chelonus insularis TaxID=460826 RepID=UPI00158E24EF|nr:2-oxo-4-hydroxy-4-carboxy-5-ureidoimidazoline decarboxylase-like [Chelonus insularis]